MVFCGSGAAPAINEFGNRRNAFVFAADREVPPTFADVVVAIPNAHFRGAASPKKLSAYLRDSGVIQRSLTPRMLKGSRSVVFGARRIAVRAACG